MKLHLINGFLGSGKTTAIIAATKSLIQKGQAVGIATNDKGQFQVDTAFLQSSHIPTRQVTGGCFRCSFSEFEEKILQLQDGVSLLSGSRIIDEDAAIATIQQGATFPQVKGALLVTMAKGV